MNRYVAFSVSVPFPPVFSIPGELFFFPGQRVKLLLLFLFKKKAILSWLPRKRNETLMSDQNVKQLKRTVFQVHVSFTIEISVF